MNRTSASIDHAGRLLDLPAVQASANPDRRRWLILGTVGLAQLMVVLDSITTGFLSLTAPKAQATLRASH